MSDRIADPWGRRTPYGPPSAAERVAASLPGPVRRVLPREIGQRATWPVRVDMFLEEGVAEADVDRWVRAASILHSNGDAMDIAVAGGRIVGVRGRAGDRVNRGRLDPKDLYGWQANNSPDRLTRPLVRQDGQLVETGWDDAMGHAQLGQPAHRRAGPAVERRLVRHPALGAADARHADLPLRRAGLDQAAVDLGHEPRRLPA
ncbi:hypothetical protein [Nonomuraea harbinensis]|uniref:4Fe-4S Mo/W bis-MGD-type domain-containing protein n=1 Tax=Nonomuraea harbinensis TaxID=1286938 RepID=A0ABW1C549_9ACTN|nr:hypothetical protein [Nonomuraea harbinensis]